MKLKKWLYLLIPTLVLLPALFFTRQVLSQQSIGIALSPPTFELSANPGDILNNTIRVENLNEVPIQVSVERQNFTALGEEGSIGLTEETTAFSLASWITVTPNEAAIVTGDRAISKVRHKADSRLAVFHFLLRYWYNYGL